MERRGAQRCSSRSRTGSDYKQVSELSLSSADGVDCRPIIQSDLHDGSPVHDSCAIAPRPTRACRKSKLCISVLFSS